MMPGHSAGLMQSRMNNHILVGADPWVHPYRGEGVSPGSVGAEKDTPGQPCYNSSERHIGLGNDEGSNANGRT
jgi:hypothetical protein